MTSKSSGTISRRATSPITPSPTAPHSTKPSMQPLQTLIVSACPSRWPSRESLLRSEHRSGDRLIAAQEGGSPPRPCLQPCASDLLVGLYPLSRSANLSSELGLGDA